MTTPKYENLANLQGKTVGELVNAQAAEPQARSLAQQFAEDDMVFGDIPSTPAQQMQHATIVFEDGSVLVVAGGEIYHCAPMNEEE